MLASSTNVKKVGTTTLNGVPVTEYTGTYPISAGLAKLPASERTKVSQQLQALGLTTEHFTIWLDGKQQVRKVVTSAQGSKVHETSTIQVTSINGPVSAAIPPASQTATVPASELAAAAPTAAPPPADPQRRSLRGGPAPGRPSASPRLRSREPAGDGLTPVTRQRWRHYT